MNINLIDTYNETCMIQINMVYYSMTINVYSVESKCGYNTHNKIINKHMGYYILSFVYY
jgi:hypothetical protein